MGLLGSWKTRAAFAFALFVATFGFTGTAHAAGWGPEFRLADGFSTNLSTHMNEAGDATFLAADVALSGEVEVFSRIERSNGTTVPRQRIFSADQDDLLYAASDQDQNGTISVMWMEVPGSSCGCDPSVVYLTRLDGNGAPLPQPLTVADYTDEDLYFTGASLSVADNGRVMVGVSVFDPSNEEAWIEVFEISSDFSSATLITPADFAPGAEAVRISTNSSGLTLVAWQTGDDVADTATIESQFVSPSGVVGAPATLLSTTYDDEPALEGTLLSEAGEGTVAFAPELFGPELVEVVRIKADGTRATASLVGAVAGSGISMFTVFRGTNMSVLPGGKSLLVYPVSAGGELGLRTFVVDQDGSVVSHEIVAPSEAALDMPALAMRPDGGSLVYFKVEEIDPGDDMRMSLLYRPLTADGASAGPEDILVESEGTSSLPAFYINPAIATTRADQIAVSWTAFGLGTGSTLLSSHARIYDAIVPTISIKAPSVAVAGTETVLAAVVNDHSAVTTNWDFGDGQSASGELQLHTFQSPGSYEIKVEAIDAVGNVGRASKQIRVVAESSGDTGSKRAPNTRITHPPRLRVKVPRAVVRFASSQARSTFECRVGRGPIAGSRQARLRARGKGPKGLVVRGKWRKCSSPLRLKRLKPAVYVVRVRAVNQAGVRDRSPAVARFRVLRNSGRR